MNDAEQTAVMTAQLQGLWMGVSVAALVLGTAILISTGSPASSRLSATEARVDLSRLKPHRLRMIRAARIPGRRGAWNALVVEHDTNRLKARLSGGRTTHLLFAWSVLLAVVVSFAAGHSINAIYTEVGRTGELSVSLGVRFFALALIMVGSLIGIPMFTLWLREAIERSRMPFAWRLLAQSAPIKTLSDPRWVGQEAPRDGRVTIVTTARMLSGIEAEVVDFFAKPRRSNPTALLV